LLKNLRLAATAARPLPNWRWCVRRSSLSGEHLFVLRHPNQCLSGGRPCGEAGSVLPASPHPFAHRVPRAAV